MLALQCTDAWEYMCILGLGSPQKDWSLESEQLRILEWFVPQTPESRAISVRKRNFSARMEIMWCCGSCHGELGATTAGTVFCSSWKREMQLTMIYMDGWILDFGTVHVHTMIGLLTQITQSTLNLIQLAPQGPSLSHPSQPSCVPSPSPHYICSCSP
jgi:hypothetical protein